MRELFTEETLESHGIMGWKSEPMLRYRELAVLNFFPAAWCIVYVPEGLTIPGVYFTEADALAATIEIDRLANNWLDLTNEDKCRIEAGIREILPRHNGRWAQGCSPDVIPTPNRNGYGTEVR